MSNNFIVGIGDSGTDINAGQSVSSNTFIGTLAGNAETANKLNHTLTIGDYIFDGSTNIDITTVPIENGGTDATNAKDARTNLGITPANIGALSTANGAVGTSNIADGAITSGKIGTETVTRDKIAVGAVGTSQIENNAVTIATLADSVWYGPEYRWQTTATELWLTWNHTVVFAGAKNVFFRISEARNAIIKVGYQCRLAAFSKPTALYIDSIEGKWFISTGQRRTYYEEGTQIQIPIPIGRYMDLKKVTENTWLLTGNYAEPLIFGGTSAPSGGNDGDIYIQYS